MRLRCPSCSLRMDSRYFHQDLAKADDKVLYSICGICRQAGIDEQNYQNDLVAQLAQLVECAYFGNQDSNQIEQKNKNNFSSKIAPKLLENLVISFNTNELIQVQIAQEDFNQVMWQLIIGKLEPKLTGDFKQDFEKIGLHVNYDLNSLDYISREMVRREFNHICQYCGRIGNSVDHMNPVSLSADNSIDNLILSCQECNEIKGNMPYELFIELNNRIPQINEKLVEYEKLVNQMKAEFENRRNLLIAKTHLKNVIDDPELNAMRKDNKVFQDATDSLASDYLDLRNTRRKYFESNYKLYKISQKKTII